MNAAPCLGTLSRNVEQISGGGEGVDQSHGQSLRGRNAIGGKKHFQRRGPTEQTRQSLRAAPSGH
jgi:hypothetical protein